MDFDRVVAGIATGQHGLVTDDQGIAAGGTRRMIHVRVESGRWIAVHPGVYAIAGAPRTYEQRLLAGCLATGGVASHRAAGVLLEVDVQPGRVEISVRSHIPFDFPAS